MTNLEALKASVNYPVDANQLSKILIDRGVNEMADYTGITKPFDLAIADLYVLMVTSANISEGGYSISLSDVALMSQLAGGKYSKYGLPNPLKPKPQIRNRSNSW